MLEKTYSPATIEARLYAAWEQSGAFAAGRKGCENAEPFCIVIPPPNVTGSLHIGHALNNTLQDVLCRFERMRGKDVLWQPGTDHAGIATQMMVERKLAAENRNSRRDMGREAFLKEVWAWKAESGGTIVNQLKRLGASCDWTRERFTMDEGLSKAVLKVFVDLAKQGLIYRDKRLVNWDPKLLTAISDLEVEPREVNGHFCHFAYPVVDSAGQETGEMVTVATTRPETMLGDTAVAVHPEDERYRHLHGRHVRLPLVGRLIPIVPDDYSDPEKGTGAVKITPAHDFNDFEVGKRHGLALVNVFTAEARLTVRDNAAFLAGAGGDDLNAVLDLDGLDRFEARKRIVAMMEERGRLVKVEPNRHMVPHGDRSGVVVEPWLTDQWYCNVQPLADKAMAMVRNGRTTFYPKEQEKTFFHWLENIQPWCISRQLWWGHQIPAWYGPDGHCFVELDEAAAEAAAAKHYGKAVSLRRDEDVLDTWFSSALWPFSTLGWPEATQELKKFYPTSVLITGFDIIFFWVARMMMTGIHFLDEVPFRDVLIHGLVRDEKGKKMSKTTGNVIDPLTVIDQYGADALRFTLAAMTAQGRDVKMSMQRVEGYRNFATKLWNAARFCEMNECRRVAGFDPASVEGTLAKWIVGETQKAVREVEAALGAYRYNDAANAAYQFVWGQFCDWFLEFAKPIFTGSDEAAKTEIRATAAWTLDQILKLMHPFMPYITEELWQVTGEDGPARETMLVVADWPKLSGLVDTRAESEIGWLVDLITAIRSVRSEMNINAGAMIPLETLGVSGETAARLDRHGDLIRRLARLESVKAVNAAPKGAVQIVVGGETYLLPLAGVIDVVAEKVRLGKELKKAEDDIVRAEGKLNNQNFIARASEDVIEEERTRRADALARKSKAEEALKRLAEIG